MFDMTKTIKTPPPIALIISIMISGIISIIISGMISGIMFVTISGIFQTTAAAGDTVAVNAGYLHLKDGKIAMDKWDCHGAVEHLNKYLGEKKLLDDYALLWRAKAYGCLGDNDKALGDISRLKTEYPESPLTRSALSYEITVLESTKDYEKTAQHAAEFLKTNPGDNPVRFIYAQALDKNGDKQAAKREYIKIYVSAGERSQDALKHVKPASLGVEALIERGRNLIKRYRFDEAEELLKSLYKKKSTASINEKLAAGIALSLFRQKKYAEAALYYEKAGDLFYEARSFFRSEQMEKFEETTNRLAAKSRAQAAPLIILQGLYLRRNGEPDEALKIFESLKSEPEAKEEALWHIGWTHYLNGRYAKADEIFTLLDKKYDSAKYRYWRARSLEKSGGDASQLYAKLNDPDSIYTFLPYLNNGKMPEVITDPCPKPGPPPKQLERLAILLELKLDEAIRVESAHIARTLGKSNSELLLQSCALLKDASMYRHAIILSNGLAYDRRMHGIFYPYAFAPDVDDAAEKFSVSPFIILSLMREESRFQEEAYSVAGAIGLMQLMPKTAEKMGRKNGIEIKNSADIFKRKNNILLGAYYISRLLDEFQCIPPALASYNAGELRVRQWLEDGKYKSTDEFIEDIPFDETRNYVKRVLKSYFQYSRSPGLEVAPEDFPAGCRMM
jgi:soluble lytic murein transglycosylase